MEGMGIINKNSCRPCHAVVEIVVQDLRRVLFQVEAFAKRKGQTLRTYFKPFIAANRDNFTVEFARAIFASREQLCANARQVYLIVKQYQVSCLH